MTETLRQVSRAKRRLEDELTGIHSTLAQNEEDMTKLYNYIAFLETRAHKFNPKPV